MEMISMKHIEMFGKASWVKASKECVAPLFKSEFFCEDIKKAEIIICGLGFFKLYINGKKVSNDLFVPAWTDYSYIDYSKSDHPITDTFDHSIQCMKYNISKHIVEGKNNITISLAPGWYGKRGYGENKLCFRIFTTNRNDIVNEVLSDSNIKWENTHITQSELLYGEIQDFRNSIDDIFSIDANTSNWNNAEVIPPPESEFIIQQCPPDTVVRSITPKLIKSCSKYSIYDVGENITGWPVIKLKGRKGAKTEIIYAEEIDKRNNLDNSNNGFNCRQKDVFISDGKGRICHSEFVWHGFRYFSITNNAEVLDCEVVHTDVAITSEFKSDNETLNWIYDAYVRTQLCNMHAGIPSDCPHREGRGYTGDGQLVCDCGMLLLDSQKFYKKWLKDIADCQDKHTGHVQYTAPYVPSGGGPGGWGGAIAIVPYTYYIHFSDKDILEEFFPKIILYFKYLEQHSEADLVTSEEPWAWCLGDWCTPDKIEIPEPFVNTYFYVKTLEIAKKIAIILKKDSYIKLFEDRISAKKNAIIKNYFEKSTGNFAGNTQGANAFAIDIELGDHRTLLNTVRHYKKIGMYDTGIFGTDILTRILLEKGYHQLAFDLLTSKNEVSFYSQIQKGATTLWEYWDGRKSRSHPMFGAVVCYLFYHFIGIQQLEKITGFKSVVISPKIVDGLNYIEGSIKTQNGRISVKIKNDSENIYLDIDIPEKVDAVFALMNNQKQLKAGSNVFSIPK